MVAVLHITTITMATVDLGSGQVYLMTREREERERREIYSHFILSLGAATGGTLGYLFGSRRG